MNWSGGSRRTRAGVLGISFERGLGKRGVRGRQSNGNGVMTEDGYGVVMHAL